MPTNFPTGLDSLPTWAGTDQADVVDHAGGHNDAFDAIEALEAKVGIDGSADTTSLDYHMNDGTIHGGGGPHDILSADHSDADDTDTPANLDLLTYDTGDNLWKAQPASAHGTHGGGGGVTHAYVGYNTIGGTMENMSGYTVYAKKITLATDGLLTSIGAYVDQGQSGDTISGLAFGVWADSSGTPSSLIGQSGADNTLVLDSTSGAGGNTTGRWFHMPSGIWLTAGDWWIGVHTTGISASFRIAQDDVGSGSHDRTYNPNNLHLADWGFYTPTTTTKRYSIRGSFLT